ncbi:hypothetical protein F2Q69_00027966 [Brassica cretica]|uniref:Uncharacterized protein n=1 Tax=Brassica cretica TaxID=69181 RepID=A0A8S9RX58_BRACR|nr:hypothetical protein F2Q69_00027966 [Brassica cretica]
MKSEFDTISGEELRGRGEDGFQSIQSGHSPNWTGPARRTVELNPVERPSWTGPAQRTAELNHVVDPARPFVELDWSSSANGRADSRGRSCSAILQNGLVQLGERPS